MCLKFIFMVRLQDLKGQEVPKVNELLGTFLRNITNNATFTFLAQHGNSSESESGTWDFCKTVDSIDQPIPGRKHECPPQKGFGLVMMSGWVWLMFIVPVSLVELVYLDMTC